MAIKINGNKLSIDILVDVARNNKKISLSKESVSKIKECRKMVENKISKGEIMYGINTGIGEFSETVLDPTQIKDFQKSYIHFKNLDKIVNELNTIKNKKSASKNNKK